MAGQNIKKKVPDVSDSSQNVETTCNSKLKFTELKDLFIKRAQKNHGCVTNTAIAELRIFNGRHHFR